MRLGWLWLMQPHPLWLDEAEYLQIAHAVRGGSYIDNAAWLRVPLFPLWLALALGPMDSLLLARLAHIGLSVVFIYQVHRIALVTWQDGRVAAIASLGAAISLPLIAYARLLMAETLLLVLLSAFLLVLLKFVHTDTRPRLWRGVAQAGVLLGLAALTKPIALACLPVLLVAIWIANTHPDTEMPPAYTAPRVRWTVLQQSAVALLCFALVIAPWTLRNALVHHRLIVLDTTGGFNLWHGNRVLEQDATAFEAFVAATSANLTDRERAFAARAWDNLLRNPSTSLQVLGQKFITFWRLNADVMAARQPGELFFRCTTSRPGRKHGILTPDDVTAEQQSRFCPLLKLHLIDDLFYLALLSGVTIGTLKRQPAHFTLLAWTWLLPIYTLTVLTVVQPRLRLPLMPILLPWSAAGLMQLFDLLARSDFRATWLRLTRWHILLRQRQVIIGLTVLLAGLWLLKIPAMLGSQLWQTCGWISWKAGNTSAAFGAFQSAAAWYPERISSLLAAGQVAEALGFDAQALSWYRAATSRVSYEPQARIGAARILLAHGDYAGARSELDSTLMSGTRMEAWGFAAKIIPSRAFLDVGNPVVSRNYGYLIGFYLTRPGTDTLTFRPTGDAAALRFGTLPTPTAIVQVRLSGGRPPGAPQAWTTMHINQQVSLHTAVDSQWRIYQVIVPPAAEGITVALHTTTFSPISVDPSSADTRAYGIALDWAKLITGDLTINRTSTQEPQASVPLRW